MSNVNALFWKDYFCDKTHYFDVYQWILQQDPLFRFSLNTHLVYELSISLNSPIGDRLSSARRHRLRQDDDDKFVLKIMRSEQPKIRPYTQMTTLSILQATVCRRPDGLTSIPTCKTDMTFRFKLSKNLRSILRLMSYWTLSSIG